MARMARKNARDWEHELQATFVQHVLNNLAPARPELDLLYAVPNGGDRNVRVAVKLKKEGVRRGVLDLVLPVPRGTYLGLYLETKIDVRIPMEDGSWDRRRTRLSKDQKGWARRLAGEGYAVAVYRSLDEGIEILERYLRGEHDNEAVLASEGVT